MLQPINNARTLSGAGLQDLDIWLSGPGFQDLNARFQDLDLRTSVSGPQREVSGPGSQDLGFRPSVFGSEDLGFRTSKALHPTVVLSFSRHFSLRPPSLFSASSGHRQTDRSQTDWPASVGQNYTEAVCPGRFSRRKSVCPSVRPSDCPGRFRRRIKTRNRRVGRTDKGIYI